MATTIVANLLRGDYCWGFELEEYADALRFLRESGNATPEHFRSLSAGAEMAFRCDNKEEEIKKEGLKLLMKEAGFVHNYKKNPSEEVDKFLKENLCHVISDYCDYFERWFNETPIPVNEFPSLKTFWGFSALFSEPHLGIEKIIENGTLLASHVPNCQDITACDVIWDGELPHLQKLHLRPSRYELDDYTCEYSGDKNPESLKLSDVEKCAPQLKELGLIFAKHLWRPYVDGQESKPFPPVTTAFIFDAYLPRVEKLNYSGTILFSELRFFPCLKSLTCKELIFDTEETHPLERYVAWELENGWDVRHVKLSEVKKHLPSLKSLTSSLTYTLDCVFPTLEELKIYHKDKEFKISALAHLLPSLKRIAGKILVMDASHPAVEELYNCQIKGVFRSSLFPKLCKVERLESTGPLRFNGAPCLEKLETDSEVIFTAPCPKLFKLSLSGNMSVDLKYVPSSVKYMKLPKIQQWDENRIWPSLQTLYSSVVVHVKQIPNVWDLSCLELLGNRGNFDLRDQGKVKSYTRIR